MVIFVDVDDTIVRSFGSKRIPIPTVIAAIRQLHERGETLYCWSRGGAKYAEASAIEFGIADCFAGFLPKPDVLIDDQALSDWQHLHQVHPTSVKHLLEDVP
jgi:cation transport ATPase